LICLFEWNPELVDLGIPSNINPVPFWDKPKHIHTYIKHTKLVGDFNNLEKYEFVNGKDDIPYMNWKIISTCSKAPTRKA